MNNQSVCYGFKPQQGAKAQGMGYQEEVAPTLNTSMNAGVLQLNDQGDRQMGVTETQESGHWPLAYGISSFDSNAMKSSNPHSGIYKADTSRTLDLNGGSPACNQGGMMVVQGADKAIAYNGSNITSPTNAANPKYGDPCHTLTDDSRNYVVIKAEEHGHQPCVVLEGNGSRPSHKGDGYAESDVSYTLNSTEQHAVCFSQDAYDKYSENSKSATIKQSGGIYGGGSESIVIQ